MTRTVGVDSYVGRRRNKILRLGPEGDSVRRRRIFVGPFQCVARVNGDHLITEPHDRERVRASAREFGSPQLALLPIGAYEPRWFMSPVHMDPEEAVRAHEILDAKTSIAIHHGTFQLADDGIDIPQKNLWLAGGMIRF